MLFGLSNDRRKAGTTGKQERQECWKDHQAVTTGKLEWPEKEADRNDSTLPE